MNPLLTCRNFRSIEWHLKTYHKISLNYVFWCTVLTAFNLTVRYYISSGNFFQWSLERSFFCFLCIFSGFRFVSKPICLFPLFPNGSETPKQTEKIVIGFAKQTENEPKQIDFRFVSVRTEKYFLFVSRTPTYKLQRMDFLIFSLVFIVHH
jgi:hypothetical protein